MATTTTLRERLLADEEASRDNAFMVAGCAFCPDWEFVGTAGECRDAARTHRRTEHPDIPEPKPGRRRAKKVGGWNTARYATTDRDEVEEERRKRMYLLGIE